MSLNFYGVASQHDADGFLISKTQGTQVTTYDYSLRGELLKVAMPAKTVEYVHDPLGRRIAKKVGDVITENYLWQGMTRLLAVYDGNNNLLMRFEYADGRMPVAMTKAGVRYYLAYDQVGTLKAVADSSGTVLLKRQYDSFGNILNEESTLPFAVPFGFAGGLHDKDTGLVRFGYRDYDPETGRWTAKDPILFAGGDTDLYGYCVNDPINKFDLSGLEPVSYCYGKVRTYDHAYICHGGQCAGLMPMSYWSVFYAEGRVLSEEYNPDNCREMSVPEACDQEIYESCVAAGVSRAGEYHPYGLSPITVSPGGQRDNYRMSGTGMSLKMNTASAWSVAKTGLIVLASFPSFDLHPAYLSGYGLIFGQNLVITNMAECA